MTGSQRIPRVEPGDETEAELVIARALARNDLQAFEHVAQIRAAYLADARAVARALKVAGLLA